MDWKSTLGKLAPVIAGTFGTPIVGLGVKALVDALGLTDDQVSDSNPDQGTVIQVALAGATPEQLQALVQKDAELRVELQSRQLDRFVDVLRAEQEDRANARQLGASTGDKTQHTLAYLIIGATVLLEGSVLFFGLPKEVDPVIVGRILGTFETLSTMIASYYFGTSLSSKLKETRLFDKG